MRVLLPLFALLSLAPVVAAAQAPTGATPRPAEPLVGGWIGASVAPSTRFGPINDRRFFVAALRAQYLIGIVGPVAVAGTFDVVPLAILSNTPTYQTQSFSEGDGTIIHFKNVTGRAAAFGAGVMPVGLQLYARSVRPARLFLGGSTGLLWFTRDTPVPDARRLNIAAEGGAGVELISRDGRALVVGYKFQHLSNGETAPLNPGFDAHVVYVGVMRGRGGRRNGHGETAAAR
jgi:hypothetical protein